MSGDLPAGRPDDGRGAASASATPSRPADMETAVRGQVRRTRFYLPGTYDIFITHSWRYDEAWTDMVALLDGALGSAWRNWSLPWHDPGLDRYSPEGRHILLETLDGQLSQSGALLVLAEVCKAERGPHWMRIEIDIAKKYGCPILGVASRTDQSFPEEFAPDMEHIAPWSAQMITPFLKPLG